MTLLKVHAKCDFCGALVGSASSLAQAKQLFPEPVICSTCNTLHNSEDSVSVNIEKAVKEELQALLNADEGLSLKTLSRVERLASTARTLLSGLKGTPIPKRNGIYGAPSLNAYPEADDADDEEIGQINAGAGTMSQSPIGQINAGAGTMSQSPIAETGGASMIQNLVKSLSTMNDKPESTESLLTALDQAKMAGEKDLEDAIRGKLNAKLGIASSSATSPVGCAGCLHGFTRHKHGVCLGDGQKICRCPEFIDAKFEETESPSTNGATVQEGETT